MVINAVVRLQRCTTKDRRTFVQKGWGQHGIAAGPINHYKLIGNSWASLRRLLKDQDVMGYSQVRRDTVEAYVEAPIAMDGAATRELIQPGAVTEMLKLMAGVSTWEGN